jgi:PEP-CTERM motif-containing protein
MEGNMFKRFAWLGSLAILLALVVASPPSAEAVCTTGPLILVEGPNPGGCIVSGDKIFDNFVFSTSDSVTATLNAVTDQFGNHGFSMSMNAVIDSGNVDISLGYHAEVAAGSPDLITDMHLRASGFASGGSFTISETVVPETGASKALSILCSTPNCDGPTDTGLTAVAFLDTPVASIDVLKDVILFCPGGESSCLVTVSLVEQTLSQTAVPEPATLLLLGSSLAGAGLYSRRKWLRKTQV